MPNKKTVSSHFDNISIIYDNLKDKNRYYYDYLKAMVKGLADNYSYKSVLEIGCGTGDILISLNPDTGVGIDISPKMIHIAKKKDKGYSFVNSDLESFDTDEKFDLILLVDVIEHLENLRKNLLKIRELSNKKTKILISSPSYYWGPILFIGERLKMKMPEGEHRWIPPRILKKNIEISGMEIIDFGYRMIIPKRIPFLSDLFNSTFYRMPVIRNFGLINYIVCQLE